MNRTIHRFDSHFATPVGGAHARFNASIHRRDFGPRLGGDSYRSIHRAGMHDTADVLGDHIPVNVVSGEAQVRWHANVETHARSISVDVVHVPALSRRTLPAGMWIDRTNRDALTIRDGHNLYVVGIWPALFGSDFNIFAAAGFCLDRAVHPFDLDDIVRRQFPAPVKVSIGLSPTRRRH